MGRCAGRKNAISGEGQRNVATAQDKGQGRNKWRIFQKVSGKPRGGCVSVQVVSAARRARVRFCLNAHRVRGPASRSLENPFFELIARFLTRPMNQPSPHL